MELQIQLTNQNTVHVLILCRDTTEIFAKLRSGGTEPRPL